MQESMDKGALAESLTARLQEGPIQATVGGKTYTVYRTTEEGHMNIIDTEKSKEGFQKRLMVSPDLQLEKAFSGVDTVKGTSVEVPVTPEDETLMLTILKAADEEAAAKDLQSKP